VFRVGSRCPQRWKTRIESRPLRPVHHLPAVIAYSVGMSSIQYTIRGIPPVLDAELRREASTRGKTLNAIVVETLEHAKLPTGVVVHDDLDWFVGSRPPGDKASEDTQTWLDSLPVQLS
jgi:hypothetical protein